MSQQNSLLHRMEGSAGPIELRAGMRRRELLAGMMGVAAVGPSLAQVHGGQETIRVGYLNPGPHRRVVDAFRKGLADRGYTEGQNLILDYRSADGRADRLGPLATELVQLPPMRS
jgi:putative ABC transport system substrate-binding protein